VHTSEIAQGSIQNVSEDVTTHPPTRQTRETFDLFDCAKEVSECLHQQYTLSSRQPHVLFLLHVSARLRRSQGEYVGLPIQYKYVTA
jgi:hypothetical protein